MRVGNCASVIAIVLLLAASLAYAAVEPTPYFVTHHSMPAPVPPDKPTILATSFEWLAGLLEKPTDTLLVLFNGILAFFTYRLFIATKGLWVAAKEQATDTKRLFEVSSKSAVASEASAAAALRSADVSEKALTNLERPYLFIERELSWANELLFYAPGAPPDQLIVDVFVKNLGRTPAIMGGMMAKIELIASELPERSYTAFPTVREGIGIGQGERSGPLRILSTKKHAVEIAELQNDRRRLFFYGECRYRDVLDYEHVFFLGGSIIVKQRSGYRMVALTSIEECHVA